MGVTGGFTVVCEQFSDWVVSRLHVLAYVGRRVAM
jgi:hypothetical protein